jgi:riboflavin synthase
MFTGIIEEVGRVISAQTRKLVIAAEGILHELKPGGSIAVNGVCLTITNINSGSFSIDIMAETLKRTNLGLLTAGEKVNLERPLTLSGSLGGHLVQGHIDATGKVTSTRWDGEAMLMRFDTPSEIMCYVVEKGFIAVDGISLTVVAKDDSSFQVSIVDYTRQHTTLGDKRVGSLVNLEVDIIAKYVEQLIQTRKKGITTGFLQEHGFLVG